MFFPIIVSEYVYEGPISTSQVDNKKDDIKVANNTNSIYDYVYLMNNNEILKFKLMLDHMDVVDAIENYVKTADTYDFSIMSEDAVKDNYRIKLSFFPFVGKFRLKDNLKKTKNYFVPKITELFNELINLYFNSLVTSSSFEQLYSNYNRAINNENNVEINIIKDLLSKINFELVERLDITTFENVVKSNNNYFEKNNKKFFNEIKWILESSKENKNRFNNLNFIFDDSIKPITNDENKLIK